jgi:PAS domain S-box-containing protein
MESILEELNEGVIIVDDQLRMIFANEALVRLGHYERGEVQGRTPEAIFPREDLPYIMRQHELSQRYGRHRNEFYFPRKDGEKIPAIFSGRVIKGPDGQDYGLVIVTDISAQKHVEEQLHESKAAPNSRSLRASNKNRHPHHEQESREDHVHVSHTVRLARHVVSPPG